MKRYFVSAALGVCLIIPAVSGAAAPDSFEEKLSYSMGFEVGSYCKGAGGDIQKEFLITGIEDAYKGAKPVLTEEEMLAVKQEFAKKMQAKQIAQLEEMKAKNKTEGEAFLAENAKKEGVKVTESGLQYEILTEGSGELAKAADTVKVNYAGTLIDGTGFDSTDDHGAPAEFQVDQVIKGWSEALQLMKPGSKMRLVIPSELAYGEQGAAPKIQPNSALVFEVELLEIVTKK